MKTMTTHTLRATLMALFCLVALSAMADATVNVTTTEGGQLQAKVEATGNTASDITSLTVTGPLNGTDIKYLRNSLTNVQNLDLTDARIVSGGDRYYGSSYSTSDDQISHYMFSEMTWLVSLKMPSTATEMGVYACQGCTNLTTVELPDALEGGIQEQAFSKCSKLTSIVIPEGVSYIDYMAFYQCSSLESVALPSTLYSIGLRSFESCGLTSIDIPSSVTSVGSGAFGYNTRLQRAVLGAKVNMNMNAFDLFLRCSSLQELTINCGTVYNYFNAYISDFCQNCTLYVPEGSESLYAAHPDWSQFKEIKTFETGNMLNKAEFALLQQIYTALDGAHWTRPWDLSKRSCSQGKWAGLTLDVSEDSHVTAIDLTNMGITGTLPAALFQFPQVTTVNIQNNEIEGDLGTILPEDYTNNTITEIRMKGNRLTGDMSIFAQHFTSPQLTTLDFSYNRINRYSQSINVPAYPYTLKYEMQFVDYKTKQPIVTADSPVNDINIGEYFIPTVGPLQSCPHEGYLGRLYFVGNDDYIHYDYNQLKWVEQENGFTITNGFSAPRNEILYYAPNAYFNSYQPIFLRFDWLDGDVNADRNVDVSDLSLVIHHIMNGSVPSGVSFNRSCADDNGDDVIDVYDAVRCVNHILDFEPSADARQARYVRRAQAEATANSISIADQTLSLATDGAVSAMQFTLSGANEADIHLARRYQSFLTMATRQVGNDVRVVLYNTEGRTLAQGMHNLLSVSEGCELSDAMLSDSEGHRLPAAIGGNATGIEAVTAEGANAAYDLQGRRSSAQRGIHIINNKKVLKR